MAASSAADIPESKIDYCPCNRCTVARKQGRQEIIDIVRELHKPVAGIGITECAVCVDDKMHWTEAVEYPCPTVKALEGIK